MIKFSVFYPNQQGKRFDWNYYLEKHVPLVKQKFGDKCKEIKIDAGMTNELSGQEAVYIAIFHILCDSVEDFKAGLTPHAQEIFADVANYTDIEPMTQLSRVQV